MGSNSSTIANVPATGQQRQRHYADQIKHFNALDGKDIYETFGFERYAVMDESNLAKLNREYRRLQLTYHPDRNIGASPVEIERLTAFSGKINLGQEILKSPEKKRRHDVELRRMYGQEETFR